jgi:predicted TIM-barrel fold metal-dependent hydrolase
VYADHLLQPWLDSALAPYPQARIFDCHTHVGEHDPSGFSATLEQLTSSLQTCDAQAAVFPLAEPDGYEEANRRCAEAAAASDGRLTAFVRVTPDDRPAALLARGLDDGARGLKLHPSSDEFSIDDPRLAETLEIADAVGLPVIVHAGPELAGIGETALDLCDRYPGLNIVLAHCALTDQGWIWRRVADVPNLFFDTSWWGPVHLVALLKLIPPGRILNASDVPYCSPLSSALTTARCARQAGLDSDQVASVLGGQFRRLLDREPALDLGPAPQREARPMSPLLEILSATLLTAVEPLQRGDSPGNALTVARHACKVADEDPDAEIVASIATLLELYEDHHDDLPQQNQFAPGWDLVTAAAIVARTPAAPVP